MKVAHSQEDPDPAATGGPAGPAGPGGVWHFLNDPRAFQADGKVFLAVVEADGSPAVLSHNRKTTEWTKGVLRRKFKVDDHISPTLAVRQKDNRLLAFYARGSDVFYHLSDEPLDASSFGQARRVPARDGNFPHPAVITENGKERIFLFYRDTPEGGEKRPMLAISDDGGESWGDSVALTSFGHWLYPKAIKAGEEGAIHLLVTSNPFHQKVNNLYYLRYQNGAFYRADGSPAGTLEELPLSREDLDTVYESPGENENPAFRASDLTVDREGNPAIAGVLFEGDDGRRHILTRFRFDGTEWERETFAETLPLSSLPEVGWVYFGGMTFAPGRPDRILYSAEKDGVFELFMAERNQRNGEWQSRALTSGAENNRFRPWPVRNNPDLVLYLEGELKRFSDYDARVRLLNLIPTNQTAD